MYTTFRRNITEEDKLRKTEWLRKEKQNTKLECITRNLFSKAARVNKLYEQKIKKKHLQL